ncbi:MAG: sulfite exporter TauE/SafE family protein [Polyangiaceae bacterium]|nr:sulfite exporter TauE/SafE family protein [Polyangiaceae bacterium]
MDTQAWIALALIVAFAFAVESALGFGATVVTVALASLVLPIDAILASFVPVNMVLSAILVARGAQSVAWRMLWKGVLPFVAAGLPIGIVVLSRVDERWLKLAFGAFVIVLSAMELFTPARADAEPERPIRPALGGAFLALGGMIHGAFGTGGPMVVYVLGRRLGDDKAKFRATLSMLWLSLNTILVGSFVVRGTLTAASLRLSAALLPCLLFGLLAGEIVFRRVSAARFRLFVFVMLALAGAVLVIRSIG